MENSYFIHTLAGGTWMVVIKGAAVGGLMCLFSSYALKGIITTDKNTLEGNVGIKS